MSRLQIIARRNADKAKKFLVKKLNKDGSVSKSRPTDQDWQLNGFRDREASEKRVVELEKLNPGSKFVVVEL